MIANRSSNLRSFERDFNEDEDTTRRFQSMLMTLSLLSKNYFPVGLSEGGLYSYCRAAVWIKQNGKNILLLTASMNEGERSQHTEEVVAKIMFSLYAQNNEQRDFQLVSMSSSGTKSLNFHRMFIDVEPCDGERFGKYHHCDNFFTDKGKRFKINGKFETVKLNGITYWNVPLPAPGASTGARSQFSWLDKSLLDIHFVTFNLDEMKQMWDECLIVDSSCFDNDGNIKPIRINLAQYFSPKLKYEESSATKAVEDLLQQLANNARPDIKVSEATLAKLKEIQRGSEQWKLFIHAIAEGWTLAGVVKTALPRHYMESIRELSAIVTASRQKRKVTPHVSQSVFNGNLPAARGIKRHPEAEIEKEMLANAKIMRGLRGEFFHVCDDGMASVAINHLTSDGYKSIVNELPALVGLNTIQFYDYDERSQRAIFAFTNRESAEFFVRVFDELRLTIQYQEAEKKSLGLTK